jgi:hypothetical protein
MNRTARALRRIAENAYVGVGVGGAIVVASVSDAWESWQSIQDGFQLHASHGMLLYGCVHLLKAFADLIEGTEHIEQKEEKRMAGGTSEASMFESAFGKNRKTTTPSPEKQERAFLANSYRA